MSNRSGGAVTNPQSHYPNRCAGGVNAQSATGFIGFIGFSRAFIRSTARAFIYTTGSVRCNLFDLPRVYLSIEIFGCKIKVAFVPTASHQRGECFKVVIYSRQAAIIFLLEGLFKSPGT